MFHVELACVVWNQHVSCRIIAKAVLYVSPNIFEAEVGEVPDIMCFAGFFGSWLQGGYHAVIRYCFLPSKQKTEAELDPEPLLFAADSEGGVHPPLYEAMHKSFSAKAG